MKKLLNSKWFIPLIINLLIVGIIVGTILYTLTYKSVPIQSQHEWYGNDLHTYLIFTHSIVTIIGIVLLAIVNLVLFIQDKKD